MDQRRSHWRRTTFHLVSAVLLSTYATKLSHAHPVEPEETTGKLLPEGKQGILEIPKNAATIIRNYIDKNLQSYLGLTTPAPDPNKPPELTDSIVGHFLLGNWYATIPPAPTYNPNQTPVVHPIYMSNEPSYINHAVHVTAPPTTPPPPPPPQPPQTESGAAQPSSRPRTRRTTKTPVHILDLDPSLNGIYNSYGVLLNSPDEVYWIEDASKGSVIIPIEPSTTARPRTARTTERSTVKTTTDADDDDEEETFVVSFRDNKVKVR